MAKIGDLSNPVSLVLAATKRIKAIWWGVGVAAVLALVAIVSKWNVPVPGLVLGGLGLFVGMFGLVVFAALVMPPPEGAKPPLMSLVAAWAFIILLICCGFLTANSFFFDAPIPLRSKFFPQPPNPSAMEYQRLLNDRYGEMRAIIVDGASKTSDKETYSFVTEIVLKQLAVLEDANAKGDLVRIHDGTKKLLKDLDSEKSKKAIPSDMREELKAKCYIPRDDDPNVGVM